MLCTTQKGTYMYSRIFTMYFTKKIQTKPKMKKKKTNQPNNPHPKKKTTKPQFYCISKLKSMEVLTWCPCHGVLV